MGEFKRLQITEQVHGLCAVLPADSDTLRRYVREESFHLDCEIDRPPSETTVGRRDAISPTSRLRINQEYSELVCSYLRDKWALEHGLDLAAMAQERLRFMEFVRKHATNAMESVPPAFDWQAVLNGQKQGSIAQRPAFQLTAHEEVVLCAQVRYVLIFSDESRVWLAASKPRPPHANEEHEFEACLGVGEAARLEVVVPELAAERQKLEAVPAELAARTKDLTETLGKVSEALADPLVAAAKDACLKRGVPPEFAWWVFQERHFGKFPTVDGAYKRCGLGQKLRRDGSAFSRPTVGRWLEVIREELAERKRMPKRRPGRGAVRAPEFDVARAKDTGPLPGDADEPPEGLVRWVEDRDAAGTLPTIEDLMAYVRDHADIFDLKSSSDNNLRAIAGDWLNKALQILNSVQPGPLEPDNDSGLRDDD